jgi:large subunit ribosomal protein L9
MKVILLERVAKLGFMGEEVNVKEGYARNFLLPQGKALRANSANRTRFETEKEALEERNKELMSSAEEIGAALGGKSFIVIRSAGETGQLYGSVASRDVVSILDENGFKVSRSQVDLNTPIKTLGLTLLVLLMKLNFRHKALTCHLLMRCLILKIKLKLMPLRKML